MNKKIKLNLGCGTKYLQGYINCDFVRTVKIDKYIDLNRLPYPFHSNYADEILMDNVLEHLGNIVRVMEELHRVLKPNGVLRIYVPYAKSSGAFQDPTHTHFFTESSMDYFTEKGFYTKKKFSLNTARLFTDNKSEISKIRKFIPFKPLLRYLFWNIYDGVFFELKAIK